MYLPTPHGIIEKSEIVVNFLSRKMNEYEKIKQDIKDLKGEVKPETEGKVYPERHHGGY